MNESVWRKDVRLAKVWPVIWFGAVITAVFLVGIADQIVGLGPENFETNVVDQRPFVSSANTLQATGGITNLGTTGWATCYGNVTNTRANLSFASSTISPILITDTLARQAESNNCAIASFGSTIVISFTEVPTPGGLCDLAGSCWASIAKSFNSGASWEIDSKVVFDAGKNIEGGTTVFLNSSSEWWITVGGHEGDLWFVRTMDAGDSYVVTNVITGVSIDVAQNNMVKTGPKLFLVYARQSDVSLRGIYIINSTDNGTTWGTPTLVSPGLNRQSGIVKADDGSFLVWRTGSTNFAIVRRSIDGGETWADVAGGDGTTSFFSGIAKTTEGTLIWYLSSSGFDVAVRRSFDNGTTWAVIEGVLPKNPIAPAFCSGGTGTECKPRSITAIGNRFAILGLLQETNSGIATVFVVELSGGFELIRSHGPYGSLRDVRTDYVNGTTTHSVFVYEGGTTSGAIEKLSSNFGTSRTIQACAGEDGAGGDLTASTVIRGLTVAFDSWIAHTCDTTDAQAELPSASRVIVRRPTLAAENDFTIGNNNGVSILESRSLSTYTCLIALDIEGDPEEAATCFNGVTLAANEQTVDLLNEVDDLDIDKSSFTRNFWFTGPDGTKGYNADTQNLLLNDPTEVWRGITVFGNRIFVSDDGKVRRYNFTGGSLNSAVDNSDPLILNTAGLRISKDGQWVFAWSPTFVWVINSTSMETLGTTPEISEGIIAADIDWTNTFLYVATLDRLYQFNIASGLPGGEGTGGIPEGESPEDVGDNSEGTSPGEDQPGDENPPFVPPGFDPETEEPLPDQPLLGKTIQVISDAWGFSPAAVAILIALLIITIVVYKFSTISTAPVVMSGAFVLAVGLVFAMNLIPLWLLFIVGFLILAFVAITFFGNRNGGNE